MQMVTYASSSMLSIIPQACHERKIGQMERFAYVYIRVTLVKLLIEIYRYDVR